MKIAIDIGHNCSHDTGAVSIFAKEDDLNKSVGLRVINLLKEQGHQVITCEPYNPSSVLDSLYQRVSKANLLKADIFCSIHFNKTDGGYGTEIYAICDEGRKIASLILNNICALGFKSRGVKVGSNLYVVEHTKMPSVLVECCFIDSPTDMKLFNVDKMAKAICEGLLGSKITLNNQINDDTKNIENDVLKLQKSLNRLRFLDENKNSLVEDGVSGGLTKSCVKNFQRIVGIEADGIAGVQTLGCIEKVFNKPTQSINHYESIPTRYIQFRLGVQVDGIFGYETNEYVTRYQISKGLIQDGVVGPNTWKELIG